MCASRDFALLTDLASVLEGLPDPFFALDEAWRFTYVNARAARFVGRDAGTLLGLEVWSEFPELAGSGVETELRRAQRERRGAEFEVFDAPHAVWLEVRVFPHVGGLGVHYRESAAQLRGEEARRQSAALEQRVQERTRQLRLANEELEAFSYSVSHDLRTPLRHIRGFTHLLRRGLGAASPERSLQYLERIEFAAGQMDALIEGLLNFARLSQQPLQLRDVALRGLAEQVCEALAPDSAGRQVVWRIGQLPTVRADPALLRQVLTNLFSNALKYTRAREEARIEVRAEPCAAEWAITVRDNGVGFDSRFADKLFGVFQRLHRAEDFEGTGIGLANVRRIVARHGGRVWAEGEPGSGATFGFSLPC